MSEVTLFLNQIPWFKKVLDMADALPDDIAPPWNQRQLPNGVALSNPLPLALRKILTANHTLALDANHTIATHVAKHGRCSPYCAQVREFMKEMEDRHMFTSLLQHCVMRYVDDSSNFWVILKDWRVAIFTPDETSAEILMDVFGNIPAPTEEEKRRAS